MNIPYKETAYYKQRVMAESDNESVDIRVCKDTHLSPQEFVTHGGITLDGVRPLY